MDQAFVMGITEPITKLLHEFQFSIQGQRRLPADDFSQCFALDVLHGDEWLVVVDADVKDRDDILVLQAPAGTRLSEEPSPHLLGIDAQALHRNQAVDQRIEREVQYPHGATAELLFDFVAADG